ncbi:MAG: accessory gene regulator B family protein [Erysipelotrichaceae bacterium]|nr:accessory gene regulator B family protein [Erysipelotrichaceae bacterium]
MKRKFLNSSMNLIIKNGNYTKEQIEIMNYGLETIYLMVTKMIVIFGLAYLLGIFKEVILLLITYNIIRSQAFGIHASKSIYCLISSTILFIGGALICKYVVFPIWLMIGLAIICNICLLLYAPADTYKRPLINAKKRKKFKFVSVSLGIIYTLLIIIFRNYSIVNYLLFGMIEAILMILPFTYRAFNLPYNNYKTYNCGV